jgi:hypothetical protein
MNPNEEKASHPPRSSHDARRSDLQGEEASMHGERLRRMRRWRSPWLRARVGSPLLGELLLLLLPRRRRRLDEGERGDGRVYIYR